MGPRIGLDGCGKSYSHRDSIPGPSSPYRVAWITNTFLRESPSFECLNLFKCTEISIWTKCPAFLASNHCDRWFKPDTHWNKWNVPTPRSRCAASSRSHTQIAAPPSAGLQSARQECTSCANCNPFDARISSKQAFNKTADVRTTSHLGAFA